jgi:aminopeptidase N
MKDAAPGTIYLKDYRPPDFLIETTELHFDLREEVTAVRSRLHLRRNPAADKGCPLVLDGYKLTLKEVKLDGQVLESDRYEADDDSLRIANVPDDFILECETHLHPEHNTSLEGLYLSNGMYCTQCEAEGFRKITYYLDRPDVMSVFTTTITADKKKFPILLSNGNPQAGKKQLFGKRHTVKWHDPHKKPAYLFALVAGQLRFIEDAYQTASGRDVTLRIYVDSKDLDKCGHALDSLKKAMRWDEEVYGREYDLDIFMIVAVDHFNMGAMENKGLNIFNTSCVLANPATTTDQAFQRVEAVVAHEYFHNWSGNRVTCRDWFQLSLKEGFTVFRDAEFSADMNSRGVKRVEDVALLRTHQFAEDRGPMAHPVRPDSYMEISNFYTLTVYEKGAEVVRMIHQLLGPEIFRRGTDLYFERFDGQAVTTEDFVATMEEVSGRDLKQFRRWYSQAGTPELEIKGHYDEQNATYTLDVTQSCPPTAGQQEKQPFHIPLAMGLVGSEGELPLELEGQDLPGSQATVVLDITEPNHRFVFNNVRQKPVPSLLRGFSAPVKLHFDYSPEDLQRLVTMDTDSFCRWDAAQQLAITVLQQMIESVQQGKPVIPEQAGRLVQVYGDLLGNDNLDKAMLAHMLVLPGEAYLHELADEIDVQGTHQARSFLRRHLAEQLTDKLMGCYQRQAAEEQGGIDAGAMARRKLKNTCLAYLVELDNPAMHQLAYQQFNGSATMTDTLAALTAIVHSSSESADSYREKALEAFHDKWQAETLVVNQWLQVQSTRPSPDALRQVQMLLMHPGFDMQNPNKVRALIGAFCSQNFTCFHASDGAGYRFLGKMVMVLNSLNPQIAARLLVPLTRWRRFPPAQATLMREVLEGLMADPLLSKDVYEVVSKSLKD